MIAPVPYVEPRGAVFQVYDRLRALSQLGHQVDLVTYPIGQDAPLPGLRIQRAWRYPGLSRIKVGPSAAKFPLDALLFLRALLLLLTHPRRYDVIHTHLEAGFFGAILGWLFRLPHVYDMHDDLSEQLVNARFTKSRLLIGLMENVERLILRSARVIIYVYPELRQTIARFAPNVSDDQVILIYNTAVGEDLSGVEEKVLAKRLTTLRHELQIADGDGPVMVYTGTFEPYQGLDLLVGSMPAVLAQHPTARYVLVGGLPEQIAQVRGWAQAAGVEHALRLPGRRPMEEMPLYMRLADVLVSPRAEGTNTPLKLFSYLAAGKPIVATAIHSNTQVLTPTVAELVAPTAEGLAQGTLHVLADAPYAQRLSDATQTLAAREYSFATFVDRTAHAYMRALIPQRAPASPSPASSAAPVSQAIQGNTSMLNYSTQLLPTTTADTTAGARPTPSTSARGGQSGQPGPANRRERVGALDLSIVIPVHNEEENIPLLHQQLTGALEQVGRSYEIFYVDDGSRDASFARLSDIAETDPHVTIIRFRRNFGQTAAMSAGITHSQGDIIILMDADLQNDPYDIPLLLAKLDEGYDCVSGWRAKRRDPFLSRKLPSRIANGIISRVTGVKLHDYGCTLKAYRREVLENVRLYGEMHRFIPVYASWSGARITEVAVNHRARQFGKSKYGISRTIRVVLDLLTVKFLGSYSTKPLYAFGYVGVALGALAALIEGVGVVQRFVPPYVHLNNNPLTLLGAILFVLGIQIVMMGLLAELIMRTYYESQNKPTYIVHSMVMGTPDGPITLPKGQLPLTSLPNPLGLLAPSLFGGAENGSFGAPTPLAQPSPATGVPTGRFAHPSWPPATTSGAGAARNAAGAAFEANRLAQLAAAQLAYQSLLASMTSGLTPDMAEALFAASQRAGASANGTPESQADRNTSDAFAGAEPDMEAKQAVFGI